MCVYVHVCVHSMCVGVHGCVVYTHVLCVHARIIMLQHPLIGLHEMHG